jgi:hypothetical protein
MTLDEIEAREAIRHTLAQYVVAGDQRDSATFANTFTEDGTLEMTTGTFTGRKTIHDWVAEAKPFGDGEQRPAPTFMRHYMSTTLIEFTSQTTANVRAYFTVMSDIGPDHAGYYVDRFRKTDDRWLIEHRRVRVMWRADNSYVLPEAVAKPRAGP